MTAESRAYFDAVLKRFDAGEWAYCPCCGEEWNRLKACFYYRGTEKLLSHLCVVCAESSYGLEWLLKNANLGVGMEFVWPPALLNWRDVSPRARIMAIFYGAMRWIVYAKSMHLLVHRENETVEDAKSYDNCYQAFEAIRHILDSGDADSAPGKIIPLPLKKRNKKDFF